MENMPRQSKTHIERLSKVKLVLLRKAADYIVAQGEFKNEFPIKQLNGSINDYNNFQKLRYHGLIFKVKRGTWGITRNGWGFLRGVTKLPKYVWVRDNHIQSHADTEVLLKDIWHGADYIQTTFEYFDAFNKPVGWAPVEKPKITADQGALAL